MECWDVNCATALSHRATTVRKNDILLFRMICHFVHTADGWGYQNASSIKSSLYSAMGCRFQHRHLWYSYMYLCSLALSTRFWDVTPCIPVEIQRLLAATKCFHLQGRRLSLVSSQNFLLPVAARCLLGSLFSLKNEPVRFLETCVGFLPDYTASHPRRQFSSQSSLWEHHTNYKMFVLLVAGGCNSLFATAEKIVKLFVPIIYFGFQLEPHWIRVLWVMISRTLIDMSKGLGATCYIHYCGISEPEERVSRFLRNLGNHIVLCAYILGRVIII
jgi:hypothetical protein